ncbi:microtubule associated katanin, putative [Plasmodium sp. gorilla clade G2]|uniref:microtubule associated katanin, putative n=1 Tax=Plasmodium sp. gorilla clade G2 TaxID=880535 RepID=UPI000D220152|nr:microtubule associated katanin, putative [Plasmodium sp. gorilla clade G2]SOV17080.1 microtubule associated katanin, putative [Plasmodium sp. gorilla clade G2]
MNSILYKKIKLTDDAVKNLSVIRAFKYKQSITKNISWSCDGELLLASNGNDSITLYSLIKGNNIKTLYSKKSGVDVVRFLNNTNEVIICSTKSNNTEHKQFLRFWDIKENKYIKSLPQIGNICELNGISINYNKKLMLVNSDDGHVKLYYFNCDSPLILYKSNFVRPVSCFDNEGHVFIASYGKKEIHFYDLLMYDRGEYNIIDLKNIMKNEEYITNLFFTPNNKYIIISTNLNHHYKIDSITGTYICTYKYPLQANQQYIMSNKTKDIINQHTYSQTKEKLQHTLNNTNQKNVHLENKNDIFFMPTITPDGHYIMCGGKDAGIHIWAEGGNHVTTLYGHEGPPNNVSFNPKCSVLASSCLNIALWQPSL